MADERLIVALDFPAMGEAKAFVEKLGDTVAFYKVGMELFYSAGRDIVDYLKDRDKKVFLDLKLCDIPNTVAGGLRSLMDLDVDMLSIHAFGGYDMMRTAMGQVRAKADEKGLPCPKVIAITVLTSIAEGDWQNDLGHSRTIREQAVHLARRAKGAGLSGVVASPQEAKEIRAAYPSDDFLIVTPGIRPAGAAIQDQSRIATPASALQSGATHLVVGRPIRLAQDPKAAAEEILKEMGTVQ